MQMPIYLIYFQYVSNCESTIHRLTKQRGQVFQCKLEGQQAVLKDFESLLISTPKLLTPL